MSFKTPAIAYIAAMIKRTSRTELCRIVGDMPIRDKDKKFLQDCISGMRYKELAGKYGKSLARIYQWKRTCYETLFELMNREAKN